jgi:hypothetical protein
MYFGFLWPVGGITFQLIAVHGQIGSFDIVDGNNRTTDIVPQCPYQPARYRMLQDKSHYSEKIKFFVL